MKIGEPVTLCLRNARVIDPSLERDFYSDLLIMEGRIKECRPGISLGAELAAQVQSVDM